MCPECYARGLYGTRAALFCLYCVLHARGPRRQVLSAVDDIALTLAVLVCLLPFNEVKIMKRFDTTVTRLNLKVVKFSCVFVYVSGVDPGTETSE